MQPASRGSWSPPGAQLPSVSAGTSPAGAAGRRVRAQVVRIDLVLERLHRSREGLSRAELVEVIGELEGAATLLSEVASTLDHVAP